MQNKSSLAIKWKTWSKGSECEIFKKITPFLNLPETRVTAAILDGERVVDGDVPAIGSASIDVGVTGSY